mgnify:CR=1 FL=1
MTHVELTAPYEIAGIFSIFVVLVCIALSWWALQSLRIDVFLRHPSGAQAKALQILLAIALGYQVAKFFFDYLNWSLLIRWMF